MPANCRAAARLIFERYGKDVLGFMIARLHSVDDGREAFASFSEETWHGLRKRFERIKLQLRRFARQEGPIES
jgi:hypothetical protein